MKALEFRKLIREEVRKVLKEVNEKAVEEIGDLIDQMQDNEEGLDQGLAPSKLIDYNLIKTKSSTAGLNVDIEKLKKLAKANDTGFMYSGDEMLRMSIKI